MEIVHIVPKNKETLTQERKDHLCSMLDEIKVDIQKGQFNGFLILAFTQDKNMFRWQDLEDVSNDELVGRLEMLKTIIIQRDML